MGRRLSMIVVLVWLACSALAQNAMRTVTLDHGARDARISPDGSTIAVSVLGKIWLVPSGGGEARQVTFGTSWDTHPAWSADGQLLAYAQHRASGTDIMVRNLASGTSADILHTHDDVGEIAFNQAATQVLAVVERDQLEAHIYRIPAAGGMQTLDAGQQDGRQVKAITEARGWHEWSFALAPDGKTVYLESGRYGGANLYKLDLASRAVSRLTRTTATDSNVNVTVDGRELVFLETADAVEKVMMRPIAGGGDREVFTGDYADRQISLAPEGTWAVMRAGRKLYRLDLASGKTTPIAFTARFMLPAAAPGDMAITHARLPGGKAVTIEARDGRIVAVKDGDVPPAAGLKVLDAAGKFVIPGLMDNHYHYWDPFDGAALLADGVTYIRDPGADLADSLDYKEAISLGIVPGPDIYTCGPLVDGIGSYHPMVAVEIATPEGARRMIRALKAGGVDAVKLYFQLDPGPLKAALEEARAQGLRVTGHIGVRVGWLEAMDDGINGLNHVRVWRDVLPLQQQPQGQDESLDASKHMMARMQADWNDIDPEGEAAGKIIAAMREHKIGFDPTLSVQQIPDEMRRNLGLEDFETAHGSYERMAKFVARAYRSQVMILAGTDDSARLVNEIESYVKAGIPAEGALAAGTTNGARWLGKEQDFGSLEAGRRADMVLLDGDPTQDIKNIHKIAVVIKDGRVVSRSEGKAE